MFGYVFDTMHIQILGLFIFSRLKDMHSSAWNFSSFCYLKPYKQQKKVALSFVFVVIHCVMMNFDGAWCDGMGFFGLCIPLKYAFMFPLVLTNLVSSYELFIPPALAILWVLLWTFHELFAIGLVWVFNVQCAFCLYN
jgi:hypothetical protein